MAKPKGKKSESGSAKPTRRPRQKGSVKARTAMAMAQSHGALVSRAKAVYDEAYTKALSEFHSDNGAKGERFNVLARQHAEKVASRKVRELVQDI
jgi:hypothetical protein